MCARGYAVAEHTAPVQVLQSRRLAEKNAVVDGLRQHVGHREILVGLLAGLAGVRAQHERA